MNILVVRHGQTDWNLEKKLQGKADICLNNTGLKQAFETAKLLLNEPIDLIISSPLKRAKQTAEIINENRNIPIIYDNQISERDFGEFEGKNKQGFDYAGFWSYSKNIQYEKAENIKDFFNRIFSKLDEFKEKYHDKNILIVTHGGVCIPINCYFNGIPNKDTLIDLIPSNCQIMKFEC